MNLFITTNTITPSVCFFAALAHKVSFHIPLHPLPFFLQQFLKVSFFDIGWMYNCYSFDYLVRQLSCSRL
jgi:hypothetical protein